MGTANKDPRIFGKPHVWPMQENCKYKCTPRPLLRFLQPALPTKPVSITTTMVTRTPLLLSTLRETTALFTAPHVFARGRNASSQQSLKPAFGGLGVARSRGEAEVAHKNAAVARTQEATASHFDTSGML